VDEKGPKALVQLREPVNKFPECVRYAVQQPSLSIRRPRKVAFGHSTSHTQSVALERYAGEPINWAVLRWLMALLSCRRQIPCPERFPPKASAIRRPDISVETPAASLQSRLTATASGGITVAWEIIVQEPRRHSRISLRRHFLSMTRRS
jgi:hypothetical protein